MSFGGQLRRLRLRAGLTQEVLAERAGVSVATIGALEEDRRQRPYPNTVVALAEALGLADADRAALLEVASGSSPPPTEENGREPDRASASSEAPPMPRVRLPAPATTLIGRERDVQAAAALLDPAQSAVRLLTLVGPAQARLREAADDWAVGMTWGGLSALALAVGQFDAAERYADEHLALARNGGDLLGMSQGWDELALVSLVRRDLDQAAVRLRQELALALEVGQPEHIASGLDGLAVVAAGTQPVRAARQFGAAEALRNAHSLAVLATRRPLYEPVLQAVRAALGTAAFDAAWAEGRAMTREQAVAYALE
jgi:transcriptional regulator with XRE-family HTH domain